LEGRGLRKISYRCIGCGKCQIAITKKNRDRRIVKVVDFEYCICCDHKCTEGEDMEYEYMKYYEDGCFRDGCWGPWRFFGFQHKNVIMEVSRVKNF